MSNCQVPMPTYERPEPIGELVDSLKRENDALKERVRELEEELEDERSENGWAREFLNTIGPRCGRPDCPSLVSYVNQQEALIRDLLRIRCPEPMTCADCEHEDDDGCGFMTRAIELGVIELESEEE